MRLSLVYVVCHVFHWLVGRLCDARFFSFTKLLKGKDKAGIAVHGTPSHSYGVSLAIWDHTVLIIIIIIIIINL